jgi:hypothetical protein
MPEPRIGKQAPELGHVYASGFGGIIRPIGLVGVAITSSCCATGVHDLVLNAPHVLDGRPTYD